MKELAAEEADAKEKANRMKKGFKLGSKNDERFSGIERVTRLVN